MISLRNGGPIPAGDPEAHTMRVTYYATRDLLVRMNNSTDTEGIRDLLSEITGTEIDKSTAIFTPLTAIFTPLYINYGKNTKIGTNY